LYAIPPNKIKSKNLPHQILNIIPLFYQIKSCLLIKEGSLNNLPNIGLFLLPLYVGGILSRQLWQVFWLPAPYLYCPSHLMGSEQYWVMLVTDATTATALYRFPF